MRFKNIISFPLLIILAGVLFSLYLQSYIVEGVYFSGDGGLKALLSQQLAGGNFRFDLIPPAETWINNFWQDGLYPYEPPFVYQLADKYFITFPYTFPLITFPWLALFGERGLYIIPLISTWIIWLIFYWVGRKIKLNNFSLGWGLLALIFASYLTIYSAMYWEHTLAVALCFGGISLFVVGNYPHQRTNAAAVISGTLIGLSVWFRPEFLCIGALLSGMVIFAAWKLFVKEVADKIFKIREFQTLAAKKEVFIISMWLTVASFFLSNKLIYGHALGIHGIQAVEPVAFSDRLMGVWLNFRQMSLALPEYLPVIWFPLFYIVLYLIGSYIFRNRQIRFNYGLWTVVFLASFLFITGVAILVPVGTAGLIPGGKQWGVRFLLILVPVITLLATLEFNELFQQFKDWKKYSLLMFMVCLIGLGWHKNIVQATTIIDRNNQNTSPAIEFLRQDNNRIIAISQQFVGQALEPAVAKDKVFFKVNDETELIKLSQALVEHNYPEFTYICYPHHICKLPEAKPDKLRFTQGDRDYQIKILSLGKFGKYPIYKMKLERI